MSRTLVALAALLIAVFASTVTCLPTAVQDGVGGSIYLNCSKYPDKAFVVTDVVVPGCSAPPCHFKRGETGSVTFTLKSISDETFDKVYANMCGDITLTCANLKLKDADICDLGATCPIKKGDINKVTIDVPVDSHYPKLTVTAYLYLEKDSGDTDRKDALGCFKVEISLD